MITFLEGTLEEAGPLRAVLNVGGVGYEVHLPVSSAARLPAIGASVRVLAYPVYREDSATLYGFTEAADREIFRLLVEKVNGVGPRLALGILSRLDASGLRHAISGGDVKALSACPGVGKKTAERLIVELRDKMGPSQSLSSVSVSGTATGQPAGPVTPEADAVAALMALGYKGPEAEKAVSRASEALKGTTATTEALVRAALR
ncbi:MAG: Holliday junction branch migration protein RuvA [Opitutales bacterium]